jgi:hypothetical protein
VKETRQFDTKQRKGIAFEADRPQCARREPSRGLRIAAQRFFAVARFFDCVLSEMLRAVAF